MYARVLHLKINAEEIFQFLEKCLSQEGLKKIDGAWWDGENGRGFLVFRRAFLRALGSTTLSIRIEPINERISRVQMTCFAGGWLDLGASEETVGDVIRMIRRFYTDGCLEQAHEEVWRYLAEVGFEVTPSKWRRAHGTVAFIASRDFRGVASVKVTRDGCADNLVKEFAKELAGFRQYDKMPLSGLLVVGCPESIPNAPFLTNSSILTMVERMGFTLIGFKRLQELAAAVKEGRILPSEGQQLLENSGVIQPEIISPEVAATYQRY
ncbi:MAG TPA: hypothetical protein VHR47_10485 [Bacillota bacterium]|nr:hypothetical protein [Bacillota bacterium]